MANTTNIDLVKPAGTDHALVSVLNANSDKIDGEAGNVRSNFALVQDTNTATQAISKDQLVVWKGVLKKASANIASGATLSGSNLSDDTIAAELAALNSKIANLITSGNCTYETNWRGVDGRYLRFVLIQDSNGHGICTVNGLADNQQAITAGTSYIVTKLPVTSLRDAVAFTNVGKWSIAHNSNELKFTPNSNMTAYEGDLMSIAFAI